VFELRDQLRQFFLTQQVNRLNSYAALAYTCTV